MTSAGYSGTPLAKKLGVKAGCTVAVLNEAAAAVFPAGSIWVGWPKRSSRVATDITQDVVREIALPLGLVDTKVCAISEIWSGLRVVWRKELRT